MAVDRLRPPGGDRRHRRRSSAPCSRRYPTSDGDPEEVAARHTLVDGLLVLLVVALVGGLLAVGQALARHHAAGAADQQLEAELGLTRAERVLARLLPGLVGAAIAGGPRRRRRRWRPARSSRWAR